MGDETDTDRFIGTWQLIPELCQYQDGHPPKTGTYAIRCDDTDVHMDVTWVDDRDKCHEMSYGGPMDGTVVALRGGKLEASYTRIDRSRLDSSAYFNGRETSYAHRKASRDGDLMVVMIVHHHKDERSTRNFQVYRRTP